MYRFLLDIPKYEYDLFVENSEYCNLLQSYDWAKIKCKRQVICWIENHFKKIDNYIEN